MDIKNFLELLEENASEKVKEEVLTEAAISGENVPKEILKKYDFKWAYVPEKYNILIGLRKDSDDLENDEWEIIAFEPKSKAAEKAKKGMEAEFGESMELSEAVDFANYVEVGRSGPLNYIELLKSIKEVLENKTISRLHMSAQKLITKK